MKIITLPAMTREQLGFTHKILVTYSDIAALAADSATLQLFPASGATFPAGTVIGKCAINLTTAFNSSDAAINSLLCKIGDGGDDDRFMTSTELHADGTEILYKIFAGTTAPYAYLDADTVDAVFTVAGGASPLLSETNAGALEIYLQVLTLDDLERPA